MCDIILPALAGVALLGVLGGGVGGNCNPCEQVEPCTVVDGKTITIPQLAGQGTNVVYTSAHGQQPYAPQYAQAPYAGQHSAPSYAPPSYAQPSYGAPAGYSAPAPVGYGASANYNAPSPGGYGAPAPGYGAPPPAETSAGAYINADDASAGVNVGGVEAGVDFSGPRSY